MRGLLQWLAVAGLGYVLLVAVTSIGMGFKLAIGGQQEAERLFAFASTPFTGLMIGVLATVLVQSSSTVTSVVVGLVAGGLPVGTAIPMIMGANIGTTVTNTLVSLGYATRTNKFRRAFAAATTHDFFNLMAVAIFFPLEMMTGFLQYVSEGLTGFFQDYISVNPGSSSFFKSIIKYPIVGVQVMLSGYSSGSQGVVLALMGIGLIFLSILGLGKMLHRLMVDRSKRILHYAVGMGPVSGIASGTLVTALTQSSSTTTSLVVPMVGSGLITIRDIYPFILGANIGTTFTGILAASSIAGPTALLAMQISLVHLLYNFLAVLVIYGLRPFRCVPITLAEWLANTAARHKSWVILYVATVFFAVPAALLFLAV